MTQLDTNAFPSDLARKMKLTWLVIAISIMCVELGPSLYAALQAQQTANAVAAVLIGLTIGVGGFALIHQFTVRRREWARWTFCLLLGSLTANAFRDVPELLTGILSPIELLWLIQLILQVTLVFQSVPQALGGFPLRPATTSAPSTPPAPMIPPTPIADSPVTSARICVKCGAQLAHSAAFCSSCGTPINGSSFASQARTTSGSDAIMAPSESAGESSRSSFIGASAKRWIAACLMIFAIVFADHAAGPLLPSDVYCLVGAGRTLHIPAETKANGWTMSNNCDARRPECANSWVSTPARSECIHTTIWDGYRSRLKQ